MKPVLNLPGTKRLKLRYDEPLSNFAFDFNLRRYNAVCLEHGIDPAMLVSKALAEFVAPGLTAEHQRLKWWGWRKLNRLKFVLKQPGSSP